MMAGRRGPLPLRFPITPATLRPEAANLQPPACSGLQPPARSGRAASCLRSVEIGRHSAALVASRETSYVEEDEPAPDAILELGFCAVGASTDHKPLHLMQQLRGGGGGGARGGVGRPRRGALRADERPRGGAVRRGAGRLVGPQPAQLDGVVQAAKHQRGLGAADQVQRDRGAGRADCEAADLVRSLRRCRLRAGLVGRRDCRKYVAELKAAASVGGKAGGDAHNSSGRVLQLGPD